MATAKVVADAGEAPRLTRRQAERALVRSEARKAAWTEGELLGQNFLTRCLPERSRIALTRKFEAVRGGDLSAVEAAVLTKSGAERLVEWRNTLTKDDTGRVTGTFSSGTDITDRSQAITALQVAEERVRFALQSANVGIWDMDYTTGALRWSEISEAHYGLSPGTFAGTFEAFMERTHPDDRQGVLDIVGKAMQSGSDFSTLNRSVWPDGTIRWLSGAGRILLGADGKPSRGVGISQDVTKRLELEQQYQQAQKMEAIGQLAGGVAHDFNNLLTVILGYCEMMLEDFEASNACHPGLIEIQKAGLSAAALTRRLLAFSRKEIISPVLLDLNVVLTNMRVMMRRLIREDVKIELTTRPELAFVMVDPGQIEQIVLNLSVNASDAMPKGGTLKIDISTIELDDQYATTHVGVRPGPSGYTDEAIVQHGVLAPGIAFLHKPFTAQTLGLKVREVLDQ